MPVDPPRPGPRIGGWVPPIREDRPRIGPPAPPATTYRSDPARLSSLRQQSVRRRARRHAVLLGTGVLAACAVAVSAAAGYFAGEEEAPPVRVAAPVLPPLPSPSLIEFFSDPPPGARSTHSAVAHQPAPPLPVRVATWSPPAAKKSPSSSASPAPAADLSPGRTVSLGLAADPGRLVRHRDYLARAEPVATNNRADARFTVRPGLAGQGCVSLEAAGLPGHFLRHRDFVMRLEPGDRSDLYAQDATFCPEPRAGGSRIVLRSLNYPNRHVTVREQGLRLEDVPVAKAGEFVVLPPA